MTTTRREILKAVPAAAAVAAACAVPASAIPPVTRGGKPRLRLGLAGYSMRDYLTGKLQPAMDSPRLHRARRRVGGGRGRADVVLLPARLHAGLRGRAEAPLPPARSRRLDDAHPQHLHLPGGAGAGEGDRARQALARRGRGPRLPRHPHLRRRRAEGPAGGRGPAELRRVRSRPAPTTRRSEASSSPSRTTAASWPSPDGLLEIVKAVKSEWFGVNLDTGNFHGVDPYADLARCVPYAVTAQVKVEMQAKGGPKQEADLGRLVRPAEGRRLPRLRDARVRGGRGAAHRRAALPGPPPRAALEGPRRARDAGQSVVIDRSSLIVEPARPLGRTLVRP